MFRDLKTPKIKNQWGLGKSFKTTFANSKKRKLVEFFSPKTGKVVRFMVKNKQKKSKRRRN